MSPLRRSCIFPGCHSVQGSGSVSLFKFPSDENVRKRWIDFVKRSYCREFKITTNTRLCSVHFTPDSYTNYHQVKSGFLNSPLTLVSGAEPTLSAPPTARPLMIPSCHFVNGKPTSEYPNPSLAVQVLNQTKEKLGGLQSKLKKRCISSVHDTSSSDDAAETEQHVINHGEDAALFGARAKLAMALKSSKVEKKLCHASCQTDPVQIFPNDARVILLGKDFPPLFVKVADVQGTTHYHNYHSSDQSSQPTSTLIQDTCTTNAFSQGIKSEPPTFGLEIKSESPIFGLAIKSEPQTFGLDIKSEPPTFGQNISEPPTFGLEIRSKPPTFGLEIKSEPPTFDLEIRSKPPTFGLEIRSEPPTFGPEIRSKPPTFGKEIKSEPPTFGQNISEPPTFGLEIRSKPPTFGLEIKSEPPTFGLEIKSEPPTFGQNISEPPTFGLEIRSESPTFGKEIKSKPLTHTIASPILQSSTASPLIETAAHNHQFG